MPPSFRRQQNLISPLDHGKAASPEAASRIGAINDLYAAENDAMDMEVKRAGHQEKMDLHRWQQENSDAYGQLLTELDPASPDFKSQLSQVDRRAWSIPGFSNQMVALVKENDAAESREQRRLMNVDRTRTDRLNMIKGAPSTMQFGMQDAINSGDEELQRSIALKWDDLQQQRLATTAASALAEDQREESVAAKAKDKSVKIARSAEDRKSIRDLKMAILKEEGVQDDNEAHDKSISKGSKVTAKVLRLYIMVSSLCWLIVAAGNVIVLISWTSHHAKGLLCRFDSFFAVF